MPSPMFLVFSKRCGVKFPSSSQTVPIKFLLFPSITHQNPFVPINFLLFPAQPYINPHKALTFDIKLFFLQPGNLALEMVPQ
jgi:hypothetical protein